MGKRPPHKEQVPRFKRSPSNSAMKARLSQWSDLAEEYERRNAECAERGVGKSVRWTAFQLYFDHRAYNRENPDLHPDDQRREMTFEEALEEGERVAGARDAAKSAAKVGTPIAQSKGKRDAKPAAARDGVLERLHAAVQGRTSTLPKRREFIADHLHLTLEELDPDQIPDRTTINWFVALKANVAMQVEFWTNYDRAALKVESASAERHVGEQKDKEDMAAMERLIGAFERAGGRTAQDSRDG